MTQPAPAAIETADTSRDAPRETVVRPNPGLARGRWEGPRWAFALVAALTVLGGLVWLAITLRSRRMGS